MISCAQPGVNPLAYNEYGCWCCFGGSGTPVDDVDRCCEVHDKCYQNSRKLPGCDGVVDLPYVLVYSFSCSNKEVHCSVANDKCQAAVCECDREEAHCFARCTYNPENKHLHPKLCAN